MIRIRTMLAAALITTPLLAAAQSGTTTTPTPPPVSATVDKPANVISTPKPKKSKKPRRPRGATPGAVDNYPSAPNGPAPKL